MLVDGYVRVSQVRGRSRPQFISPSEQGGQIRDWAALHGPHGRERRIAQRISGATEPGEPN